MERLILTHVGLQETTWDRQAVGVLVTVVVIGVRQERWPQCRRHLFIDVLPRLERGDDGGQLM